MSTTVVNAYIGPKVGGYVASLNASLADVGFRGDLSIMHSNGGVMTPEVATARPVAMMESGPGRRHHRLGARSARSSASPTSSRSTWAARPRRQAWCATASRRMAPGYYVGGYASGHPVMLPVVDVVEVGAGGGSIAWIDDVGALKVGPQSAGADPGPICYRGGGTEPTITDANVVLGRLDPQQFSRRRDGARRRRRTRRHRAEDRQAAGHGHRSKPRARSSRSPSRRCRSRCARCRSRRATIRAISRWSPPAARDRCMSARSRASCISRT